MHAAEGSISKLPFIRIADEDKRQAFLKKYQQAKENVKNVGNMSPAQAYKMFKYGYSTEGFISQSIPVMDLEEVLHHDLLYKFYPKARDIKVRFTEGYGASFNRGDKSITLGIDRFIGHDDWSGFGTHRDPEGSGRTEVRHRYRQGRHRGPPA